MAFKGAWVRATETAYFQFFNRAHPSDATYQPGPMVVYPQFPESEFSALVNNPDAGKLFGQCLMRHNGKGHPGFWRYDKMKGPFTRRRKIPCPEWNYIGPEDWPAAPDIEASGNPDVLPS